MNEVKFQSEGYNLQDQVTDFHVIAPAPIGEKPHELGAERLQLRLKLIAEEFVELLAACGANPVITGAIGSMLKRLIVENLHPSAQYLPEICDALADIDYVVTGFRVEMGVNGAPIADEVHRTNMAKQAGEMRADGKKLKPAGWQPPDIAKLLLAQGWEPKVGNK